jgi:CRP/FNR family transcriptional regulator, cyclic AMP receptor protein
MLGGNGIEDDDALNEHEQKPCDSPISKVRGLDNLKVSKYYARGSVLFAEGQRPRGIYVLCEGKAKVSIASAEGKTLVLWIAQPGELLGLNATLTGEPHIATVQTLERSRIDFVAREDLLKVLDRDKRSYLSVAQCLSSSLNGLVDHTRLLYLSHSASERLARLLLKWCDQHGKPTSQGIRISPGLTHEEISQTISTSRETVTRALNMLKRKHIVGLENGNLLIRNRTALMALTNR